MDKIKKIKAVREISLFVFVLATIFPEFSNKIIAISSILIWLISNLLIDRKKFLNFFIKPNLMMYSIYFWIATIILYIIIGYSPELKMHLANYVRLGITSIVYLYYVKSEEKRELKAIVAYTLIICVIINIITIVANLKFYNISRLLATSKSINANTFGVGSYFYIYGLIYPVMAFIAYFIKDIKNIRENFCMNTAVILSFVILSLYTIYITEFLIAILLLLFGLILIILKTDSVKKFVKYVLIMLAAIIIFSPLLSLIFRTIAINTDSYNYKLRAEDMHIFFSTGNIENTVDLKGRVEVYTKSIKAFLNNPLFGINGTKSNRDAIGNHSTILDQLGKFGLIGSMPFLLLIIVLYLEVYKTLTTTWSRRIYFSCGITFTLFMFINTALFVSIFYMIFVMLPMVLQICDEHEVENKLLKGDVSHESCMDS